MLFYNLGGGDSAVGIACNNDVHAIERTVAHLTHHVDVFHTSYIAGNIDVAHTSGDVTTAGDVAQRSDGVVRRTVHVALLHAARSTCRSLLLGFPSLFELDDTLE